jgi:oligopeptide/dipeptide ABC transporter ATP-binding protein
MTGAPLLSVRDLRVRFGKGDHAVQAVNGVEFDLAAGERLAIVGESGSGKSVMSLALLQLLPRTATVASGSVSLAGKDVFALGERDLGRLRGRRAAMVFQDPMTSLNPVVRIGKQLTAPMKRHLGIDGAAARDRAVALLDEVGIPDPERALRAYAHQLSGGMRQRALIAIALSCEPDLIIADEPTTSLDVTVQAQIIRLLTKLSDERGTAMILVTHDLGIVARFAQRVAVMYAGRFVESGSVDDVFARPQHPYTDGLLRSIPQPDDDRDRPLHQIDGAPPDPSALPPGCAFAARCPLAEARCSEAVPPFTERAGGHEAACWVTEARPLDRLEASR